MSDLNNNLAGRTQLAGDNSSHQHFTKIYSEPNKDLEQRDVSQETITTHNGTISNFKQSERNVPDVELCGEQSVSLSLTTGAGQDGQSDWTAPDHPEKRLIGQQSPQSQTKPTVLLVTGEAGTASRVSVPAQAPSLLAVTSARVSVTVTRAGPASSVTSARGPGVGPESREVEM